MADAFEAGDIEDFKRLHAQASWFIAGIAGGPGRGQADKAAFMSLIHGEGTGAAYVSATS